jgi:hypothetical protein
MTERINDLPPQKAARIAGLLYLAIIAGGIFAEAFVRQQAFVPGDPAATARNILEHELLYRVGFAVHLFYLACALPLALILYNYFKRVSNNLALLALIFNLIAVAIEGVNLLNQFAPLSLLTSGGLSAFSEQQLQALAYGSLKLFSSGFGISLAFFGFFGVLAGILIFHSGFLPRILGVLMTVAGLCYIVNSFLVFVVPAFAAQLFPFILMPCIVAELSFALWLLVMGVNVSKFESAATPRSAQTSTNP